jgi:DNA-3-methyladenine glycosylase II
VPDELIRGAGISPQKLGYLRSLAEHVVGGRLELGRLSELPDEEVIAELTDIKGIGVWTAQMFLIFSLGRLDVLPTGDLGVRKGMQIAYGFDELPVARQMEEIANTNRWAPYRSVGTWYMWRAMSP